MKKVYAILAAALTVMVLHSFTVPATDGGKSAQELYIEKYSAIAVSEMYRSGVPASITLAQGILESASGKSRLATEGNNHFGIKCHNWTGKSMRADDDKPNECFRVYDSPEMSYKDHSDFLRYNDRYKFLFDLDVTDYKSWANGLKKAGYATAPTYATSLVKIIEQYDLGRYDQMTVDDALALGKNGSVEEPDAVKKDKLKKVKSSKRRKTSTDTGYKDTSMPSIPDSPLSIEEPKKLDQGALEEFRFSLSRQLYSRNGVPFVLAAEGETYATIANSYNLFVKELLSFNDLDSEEVLAPGTIVYLQAKKTQAAKGLDKHIVNEGETLREIGQRYGVKLSALAKLNNCAKDYEPRPGDVVILRKL